MRVKQNRRDFDASGNWNTAKDFFPTIEIKQNGNKSVVTITTQHSTGYQKKACGETEEIEIKQNKAKDAIIITGYASCTNWKNRKCSGSQDFCYCVFVGDSGHVYVHRAPATKGWMNCNPDYIRKRLRKLGIGAEDVLQQGDFLLKPANGNALADNEFKHEYMGSGHHKFELPVLRAYSPQGTQILVQEETVVHHHAIDGIQHPDLVEINHNLFSVGLRLGGL
jgi:hypothetical protein